MCCCGAPEFFASSIFFCIGLFEILLTNQLNIDQLTDFLKSCDKTYHMLIVFKKLLAVFFLYAIIVLRFMPLFLDGIWKTKVYAIVDAGSISKVYLYDH